MFKIYSEYIVPSSALIPIITGFALYRYLPAAFKIISWFVVFSSLINAINIVIVNYGFNSIAIFNIYTIFEFAFIAAFYGRYYDKKARKIIYILMVLFGILVIINYLFIQNGYEFNTYTRPLEALIIIGFAITFILKQNSDEQSWGDNTSNWINSGILIYYSSGLAMFIFANHLLHASRSINNFVWYVHNTILMFEYFLFAVGFYKCKPQTITSTY